MLPAPRKLSQKLGVKLSAQCCLPQLLAVQGLVSPPAQKTEALGVLLVTFSFVHMITSRKAE